MVLEVGLVFVLGLGLALGIFALARVFNPPPVCGNCGARNRRAVAQSWAHAAVGHTICLNCGATIDGSGNVVSLPPENDEDA